MCRTQRRGYGAEAIAAMMRYMMAQGICHFVAEIHVENQASIATVKKLGYTLLKEGQPFALYHKRED